MGTVVERPVWLSDRPRNLEDGISFEIIDVDANEGPAPSTPMLAQAPSRLQTDRFRGQPETISLLDDSDDEIEILSVPTRGRFSTFLMSVIPVLSKLYKYKSIAQSKHRTVPV
jgi:hypothetical protein